MARMTLNKSGSFINFLSPEKANIKSLKVYFSPKQEGSGDPNPENVREIEGWNGVTVHHCGKNLLDINNLACILSSYSYVNVENGIATGTASSFYWCFSKEGSIPISNPLDKQLSVTLTAYTDANAESADSNGIYIRFYYTDGSYSTAPIFKNNDIIKTTKTGTSIAGKIIDRVCISYGTLGENIWHISDFHIEVNQTSVSYEPYNGTDYNVTFPSTVYGGYVDLITGELWSNMLYLNMGNMKWAKSGDKFISYGSQLSAQPKTYPRYYMPINWFCSKYKIGTVNSKPQDDKTMCCTINATTILLKDNSFETVEELLTNLDGIQFVYELATPQLITTITPQNLQTLINTNNFWSNADYIEIEYELAESRDIQSVRKRIMLDNQPHKDAASGQLVNFATDLVSPLKGCKVNFLPKQSGSGDPSPTNIRPISGWDGVSVTRCGKNLLTDEVIYRSAKDTLFEYTFENGTMNMTVKQSGYSCFVLIKVIDEITPEMVGLCFKYSASSVNRNQQFVVCNPDGTNRLSFGNDQTGIIASEYVGKVLTFRWYAPSSAMGTYTASNMQVEIVPSTASVATTYEPYTASTFPISWTQQGTVYGGYVNLVSGEVWGSYIERIYDGSSDESWALSGTNTFVCNQVDVRADVRGIRPLCDKFLMEQTYGTNYRIRPIGNNAYASSVAEWRTWLANNPIQVVYELATPQLIATLTPQQIKTLRGVNNIYSDTNDITEVTYYKHNNDTYQHMAADAIISNDNFVIITNDKYVIGNNQDYITY